MNIWHFARDTPRLPHRVSPDERVVLNIGTWPVEPDQSVYVEYGTEQKNREVQEGRVEASWIANAGNNSYWRAVIGPFQRGDRVCYIVHGDDTKQQVSTSRYEFSVGPRLYLGLMWHQHQPIYKDTSSPSQRGSYVHPWVRLHGIRDYYSMAAILIDHPKVRLTFNLTPALLWQIEDYCEHGATDQALELTLKPSGELTDEEREQLLVTFFDADWHNQIYPNPRYKELFTQRWDGLPFSEQDILDLQMWFNLSWFGREFRVGEVELVTGETASVLPLIKKQRNFSREDIRTMVEEQYKILRAVVPVHRMLQDRNQIEVATTPFYHPILPLIIDTDRATIDRPGSSLPNRFSYPGDAASHVRLAVDYYERCFGGKPKGMWPAEGAVSQSVIPFFANNGVQWIATDRGVLAKSGRWGYEVTNPDVLCRPYRAEEQESAISIFFRDTELSDRIGFHYHTYADYREAARDFIQEIKEKFARQIREEGDFILTIVLDGENAWGAYREDARPFLHALYQQLENDREIETVTFSEFINGCADNQLSSHPIEAQQKVFELYTGSWIDENGSLPGVDLGTWIGEDEENQGWDLLLEARQTLKKSRKTEKTATAAYRAMYMAEGSDWFWWFGMDQDSGNDGVFDDLFRTHLHNVYRSLGLEPPARLARHIVPRTLVWTFTSQISQISVRERLIVQTNCPGELTWQLDDLPSQIQPMLKVGGVMGAMHHYQLALPAFPEDASRLVLRFSCTHTGCDGKGYCSKEDAHILHLS